MPLKYVSNILFIVFAGLGLSHYAADTAANSDATTSLKARNSEFQKQIIQVAENIYTAVGYGVSPVSMIVGDSGLVIIDTGIDPDLGREIREQFRDISDLQVSAIILTHGHGDHTRGADAFLDNDNVQVWAREGYGAEDRFHTEAGLTIQMKRGAMQGGFLLQPEQRINNGIARAYWPKRGGAVFGASKQVQPTHFLTGARQAIKVAGVTLDLVAATGETYDQLYIWYPKKRTVFAGDNFYKSWPNLYAIRGTAYRDVRLWADSVDSMLAESPVNLVGGHTRPVLGESEVVEILRNYRDAIGFVFDKTIDGMNQGMTPDQLVEYVQLPPALRDLDYLQPYYGHVEWAVRSIFNGYLGWFNGNSTKLFPLSDSAKAANIAGLVGGQDRLQQAASDALAAGEAQWAAELCDYLLALNASNRSAMLIKANALNVLAQDLLTATGRNYYLSEANMLRQRAGDE